MGRGKTDEGEVGAFTVSSVFKWVAVLKGIMKFISIKPGPSKVIPKEFSKVNLKDGTTCKA